VVHLLDMIEHEMRVVMALTGCTSIERIDRSALADPPRDIAGDGRSRSRVSCPEDRET
jgi:isopentenyl diphosphate isomerase/L-lactate dehydrogenase-like FMN-dependent dehydrogenase